MVTFRLADSLPAAVLEALTMDRTNSGAFNRQRFHQLLDAGHGSLLLADQVAASIVEAALLHSDGTRYALLSWCVMPSHVHALLETRADWPLRTVVQAWKSSSAHALNKHRGALGSVWWPDYFDRAIRDDRHLEVAVEYIEQNPVKAGLITYASEWMFGSARRRLAGSGDVTR
jgi:putative transposase